MIRSASERHILDAEALSIVEGALSVAQMQARDIMIPRSQVVMLSRDASQEDILKLMTETAHSRFPVIDDDRDDVIGILLAKDVLSMVVSTGKFEFDLRELFRPAVFIPESKRLNVLLSEFRIRRNHMAIVVDEYGGASGIVTLEDILEEIVGDITDEFDEEDLVYSKVDEHTFIFEGRTSLMDFYKVSKIENDLFESLKGEAETLADLSLNKLDVYLKIMNLLLWEKSKSSSSHRIKEESKPLK